jgi:sialic acid synthase
LLVIKEFRNSFPNTVVGLSSHDRGIAFPVVAYALGARIIEKHFTIDRSMKGTDHSFSLEPTGMGKMVRDLQLTRLALGDGHKKAHEREKVGIRKMGKMLVYSRPIDAGTVLSIDDFSLKSPQEGLHPQNINLLVGSKLLCSVDMNQPAELHHLADKDN